MSFHLNSDAVALLALIVSLVALLIALLQVIQQYAATAYDYRRCSARTMGGWAKHTKRNFVLSEIRFEITFAVPHIDISVGNVLEVPTYRVLDAPANFARGPDEHIYIPPTPFLEFSKLIATICLRLGFTQILRKSKQSLLFTSTIIKKSITRWFRLLHSESIMVLWSLRSWLGDYNGLQRAPEDGLGARPLELLYEKVKVLFHLTREKPEATDIPLSTRTLATSREEDWDDWISIEPPKEDEGWSPQPREDWFLSLSGAVPEAACSWLQFLHDTQSTNMDYVITTKRFTFDYLSRDVSRPLATANRRNFLVTLTLLGVEWTDRGANGISASQNSRNKIEVTTTNIPSIGTVYSYNRISKDLLPIAAKLHNRNDYLCMFNSFRLIGFRDSIRTWSMEEIRQSLTTVLGDATLTDCLGQHHKLNGLNFGIGELIAGWSTAVSMPRKREHGVAESCFSSTSLGCTFGMSSLSRVLCNKEGMMNQNGLGEEDSILGFVDMIEGYYSFLRANPNYGEAWLERLFRCLEWASRVPPRSNILFYSPKEDDLPDLEECYNLMAEGKQGLDWAVKIPRTESRPQYVEWDETTLQKVGIALLRAYVREDTGFMQGSMGDKAEDWIREAVLLTATASVEALEELSQQDWSNREFWRNMIVNRILRGVLWTIHNGNAPGRDLLSDAVFPRLVDRSLECSLSSEWLGRNDVVYIS